MNSSATLTGCDDIIKRLREAIAARPTPGPWVVYDDSNDGKTNRIEIAARGKTVARIYRSVPEEDLPNARLIAAASPDNIAALLDRLDDLETNGAQAVRWAPSSAHWSNELKRLFGSDAREGVDNLERQLRDMTARLEAAERERDSKAAELANLQVAFSDWKVFHSTARLEAENERLREDAARYRWLRGDLCPDNSVRWAQWEVRCWRAPFWTGDLRREELDGAIDAAMAKDQK